MNIEPVPVTSFQQDVPAELDAIISRAIAKNPDDRYQTGAELSNDLQRFRENDQSLAEATSFFARVVRHDLTSRAAEREAGRQSYRQLSLSVAILTVFLAGILFGWRMTRVHSVPTSALLLTQAQSQPAPLKLAILSLPAAAPAKTTPRKLRAHKKSAPAPPEAGAGGNLTTAKVQVEIQHHFSGAKASIWFDDEMVFDQDLRGADQKHPLLRTIEMNQIASFQFASGKHYLQVRVVSTANFYDQIETLEAELAPGSQHVLHVNCDKKKMQVALQ